MNNKELLQLSMDHALYYIFDSSLNLDGSLTIDEEFPIIIEFKLFIK